jgi:hypothetical protein
MKGLSNVKENWSDFLKRQSFQKLNKDHSDHRNAQNAVNSEFEENSNEIPDNMHNI